MKIIQATGQTCNQFWIYSHYFAESLISGEKIIILAPDISLKDYPNWLEHKSIKFPFYSKRLITILSYKKYIKLLNLIFANKYSIIFFKFLFKLVPNVEFIEGKMGFFTSVNRLEHKEEIKKIFEPNIVTREIIDEFINKKKSLYDIIIGVHIRRADYITWQGGKFFYSDKQYSQFMNQIEYLFPNAKVGFLICSNESINLDNFKKNNTFKIANSSGVKDLYGLSLCNYLIGPPSSYSTWASYYGGAPLYFIVDANKKIELNLFFKDELEWPPAIF